MRTAPIVLLALLQAGEVRESRDLAYVDGPGADPVKHRLDLFLPPAGAKFPTIVWIHGGAWVMGDRKMYDLLGKRFAAEGIGLAAISYRLSPGVKHPEHARDAARAFAWVHANIARQGGDPERLFLMGHSAGGHLAALLAADPKYLKDAGVPAGTLKGAIPMSGVYLIPALPDTTRGILRFLPQAFGSDPEACRDASPVTHLKTLASPALVITETRDTLLVRPSMEILKAAVRGQGVTGVEFVDAAERDHLSIVVRMMLPGEDPIRSRILEWVRKRCQDLDAAGEEKK